MSEQAFLLISLGPIQDFIASARRCQDLWFGSHLLSHLSCEVASFLAESGGEITMVFPGSERLDDKVSVANKIAAVVPAARARELGCGAKKLVREELLELADSIFNRIEASELGRYFFRSRADDQLGSLMECPWVAVPCSEREGDAYTAARDRAEALLAARKNTKAWRSAARWADSVPKSSLDGLRESVIDERVYDHKSRISAETCRRVFGIQKTERLCGVGLLKRLGTESDSLDTPRRPHFHSTSHMAAAPLFGHFARHDVQQHFDQLLDILITMGGGNPKKLDALALRGGDGLRGERHPGPYDGSLLYEGRLDDLLEQILGIDDEAVRRQHLNTCRVKLRDLLEAIGHREPSAYYAMLLADGDRMGLVIDSQKSARDHAAFSKALDSFARNAKSIVEDGYGGSLIYSGGDDVLAMLPLHNALACAQALRRDFSAKLIAYAGLDEAGNEVKPTLSCGVAVVHHSTHFAEVREVAKRAETLAKTRRNALAVIVDKRSGGERSFVTGWDESWPIEERLEVWETLIAQQEVSHGFLREVEHLAHILQPGLHQRASKADVEPDVAHLLEHELGRIMARKEPGASPDATGLQEQATESIRRYLKGEKGDQGLFSRIQRLGNELYLALELHRTSQLVSVEPDVQEVTS